MNTYKSYFLLTLSAVASAIAVPEASHAQLAEGDAQAVDLVFVGGPASYNLTIPANGQEYLTGMSSPNFKPPVQRSPGGSLGIHA